MEAIRISLFPGERAELAAQNAIVRVVNVTIDDVAGPIADFSLPDHVGDCADGVYVLALEEPESFRFGDALTGDNLVVDVPQFAALDEKLHTIGLPKLAGLATRFEGTPVPLIS